MISDSCLAVGHVYSSVQIGGDFGSLSNHDPEIIYYNRNLIDSYPVNHPYDGTSFVGIGSGYEFEGHKFVPNVSFGAGFYDTLSSYRYKGRVTEAPLNGATTLLYNYRYRLNAKRFMAETKIAWEDQHHIEPFIDMGLGAAWINAKDYNETAVSSNGFVALPPFNSNIKANFSYQVGFGMGYGFSFKKNNVNHYEPNHIALGYRYVNLGKVAFGTRGQSYPYALKPGTLSAQEFYFEFTRFFC